MNATLELGALFIFSSSSVDPSAGFDPCCSEVRARNPLVDVPVVEAVEVTEIVDDVLETEVAEDVIVVYVVVIEVDVVPVEL